MVELDEKKKEKMLQALGILVVVVMGGSMIAGAILSTEKNANKNNQEETPTTVETSKFNYTASFETTVLKELNFVRFAAITEESDIYKIDKFVKGIDGVKSVSISNFKTQTGFPEGEWVYFAEISIEKNASPSAVAEKILASGFFSGEQGTYEVKKSVTISVPKEPMILRNTDLNMDVNFSFEGKAQTAWVELSTIPNDSIVVGGTIQLQGKTLVNAELLESSNNTGSSKDFSQNASLNIISLGEKISYEGERDLNSYVDENALKSQLVAAGVNARPAIFSLQNSLTISVDKNYTVSSSDIDMIKGFAGVSSAEAGEDNSISAGFQKEKIDSIISSIRNYFKGKNAAIQISYPKEVVFGEILSSENAGVLETILSSKGFSVSLKQDANFDMNGLMVNSFGKELPFEKGSFTAIVNPGHKIGDGLNLLLTLTVQREKISGISGEESE
ncbi:MAG: hypothetical protein NTZ73_02395 [Candidatus Diapherotrites archaeon]|nr:hypothetical protein [Candidatus Diapherotrites archaeon]